MGGVRGPALEVSTLVTDAYGVFLMVECTLWSCKREKRKVPYASEFGTTRGGMIVASGIDGDMRCDISYDQHLFFRASETSARIFLSSRRHHKLFHDEGISDSYASWSFVKLMNP